MWLELMRLTKNPPAPWTLIGAHMVAVHGWALGHEPIRTSLDADVLVDVRLVTTGTAVVSQTLVRDGFELVDYSATGVGHTFAAGDVRFDVLAPDNLGQRARLKTIRGFRTVMVPGGTQALARSAPIQIRSRSSRGTVPLPSLLGAILIKTRAIRVDDLPDNQRSDVAFLFSLVEDPDELVSQITAKERGWLRRHPYFGDPHDACWTGIVGAEDGAIVYRRLTAGPSSSSSS
jgi:hypothetical protein